MTEIEPPKQMTVLDSEQNRLEKFTLPPYSLRVSKLPAPLT
jgi:hypothetical protein